VQDLAEIPVQWFPGGLMFMGHRPFYYSTLGLKVIKKRRDTVGFDGDFDLSCPPGGNMRVERLRIKG